MPGDMPLSLTETEEKILARTMKRAQKVAYTPSTTHLLDMVAAEIRSPHVFVRYHERIPNFTVALVERETPSPYVGVSKRNPIDPIKPEVGRAIAFRRAIEDALFRHAGVTLPEED